MSDSDILQVEVSDYIAVVTMNRPPVNALDRPMRNAIIAAFDEISEREDVRVAILTGNGRAFCAGADLRARPNLAVKDAFHDHNRATRETSNAISECMKPVM